jgi:hypothetical protein
MAIAALSILLALAAGGLRVANAATVIASEDFESGDLSGGVGWVDDEWETTNSSLVKVQSTENPHGGSWHMRINDGPASVSRTVDVLGFGNPRLKFWAKTGGLEAADTVVLEGSPDGGATWVLLNTWQGGPGSSAEWAQYDIDLNAAGAQTTGLVTLRFTSSANQANDKFFIDDITIEDPVAVEAVLSTSSGAITIDSNFSDWSGQSFLSDPSGDQSGDTRYDLHEFYWANNVNQEVNYHMIKRHTKDGAPFNGPNGQTKPVNYFLHIDTNNDGVFTGAQDRLIQVHYDPRASNSVVRVKVRQANNNKLISDSGDKDWGETDGEGGLRVEFPVHWKDLGISLGAVIRMYLTSHSSSTPGAAVRDRLPDGNADIQWSPASILGPWLLAGAFILGALAIWYFRGRHQWRHG